MNKAERIAAIKELAEQGMGRPAILRNVPGSSEWEVRKTLEDVHAGTYTSAVNSTLPTHPSMRILCIDIETAPHLVHVWGMYNQNIAPVQVIEAGRVLCFAYKWLDGKGSKIGFASEYHDGHEAMVRKAWELLDEADAVVHFNGARFDAPSLNREFLLQGLTPPSPYKHIDLLNTVRKQFRFASNRLAHVLVDLDLGQKLPHTGHDLWLRCLRGEKKAWQEMEAYNKNDVAGTEALYWRVLPWISNHPNHALYFDPDRPACPTCGSQDLQSRGLARTKTQEYRRYQCTKCGSWMRDRFTALQQTKRRKVLTQAV